MSDTRYLDGPFAEPTHRALALALDAWAAEHIAQLHDDVDAACRACVQALGQGGWLTHAVGGSADGDVAHHRPRPPARSSRAPLTGPFPAHGLL